MKGLRDCLIGRRDAGGQADIRIEALLHVREQAGIGELAVAERAYDVPNEIGRIGDHRDERHGERAGRPEGGEGRDNAGEHVAERAHQKVGTAVFVGEKVLAGPQESPEIDLLLQRQDGRAPIDRERAEDGALRREERHLTPIERFGEDGRAGQLDDLAQLVDDDAIGALDDVVLRPHRSAPRRLHLLVQGPGIGKITRALVGEATDEGNKGRRW